MNNLAGCYELQSSHAEAEALLHKLISTSKEKVGAESGEVALWLRRLGLNMLKQRKFGEAETPLREALAIGEEKLPEHWTTFHAKSLLGGSLSGQQKYGEAETLLISGYEGRKQREASIPPIEKAYMLDALDRVIQFYDARKPDEAAKWHKARDAMKPNAAEPGPLDPLNPSDDM